MFEWFKRIGMVTALVGVLAACGPEASRPRGGGLGADLGNHARPEIPASKVWNTHDPSGNRQEPAGTNQ